MSRAARFRLVSPEPVRLSRPRRRLIYLQLGVLFATGLAWLVFHFGQPADAPPSDWLPWTMKLHGGVAMLLMFSLGTLLYPHMLGAWRARRNRVHGFWLALFLLVLVVTGYGLYYFDGERLRLWTDWTHWVVGALAPVMLYWHVTRGRQSNPKAEPQWLGVPRR